MKAGYGGGQEIGDTGEERSRWWLRLVFEHLIHEMTVL